ncbi:unnamed protein product [Gadus morhua 'NCC']
MSCGSVINWQRLPAKNVYYYRCPDHRRNYVMSFAFCFDREDDVYQFAYCYPYTYSRLQHYLAGLERRNLPYLQREQLGLSVQQRRLDLLTITNPGESRRDLPPPSFTPSSCLTSTLSPAIKTPIKRPLRFYWCTVYTGAHIVQDGAAGKPFPAH